MSKGSISVSGEGVPQRAYGVKSEEQVTVEISESLLKIINSLDDKTISLALRSAEARKILDIHTTHVKKEWMDWHDETSKVMEQIRQTRVAIGFESKQLLAECGDVRKFFLSDDHEKEIARLREFIELCERLRSLKNDGTLDRMADTILKL